ncbi:hypothetical protein B0J12DRAFT_745939 [Macrophomina phaseolina]|uniref:rRNA-processing protein FYV7 n=1 Tax=Macrophomina phaseolina TaxID=35725 RepID=A0ABQ8FWT0_9PEZI|nr:hypothetical protein B0J12DRAFT_745939 [Macrophomina phaseolina]
MAAKRQRDDADAQTPAKRQRSHADRKKGFSVGPANLPDGTYKRKVQKIKKDLIHKAKIKKQYAKIRERELHGQKARQSDDDDDDDDNNNNDKEGKSPATEPTLELHPERQARLDEPSPGPGRDEKQKDQRPQKRQKPKTFSKEAALGQKRKEEAEARRLAREESERQRQEKIAQRERMRKQMAKARAPGKDGKRKLGREAPVLLERVKKIVGNA